MGRVLHLVSPRKGGYLIHATNHARRVLGGARGHRATDDHLGGDVVTALGGPTRKRTPPASWMERAARCRAASFSHVPLPLPPRRRRISDVGATGERCRASTEEARRSGDDLMRNNRARSPVPSGYQLPRETDAGLARPSPRSREIDVARELMIPGRFQEEENTRLRSRRVWNRRLTRGPRRREARPLPSSVFEMM